MYTTEKIDDKIYIVSIAKDSSSEKIYVPVYKESENLHLSFDNSFTSCIKLFGAPPEKYVIGQTAGKVLFKDANRNDETNKIMAFENIFRIFEINKVGFIKNIAYSSESSGSGEGVLSTIYKFKFEDRTTEFKTLVKKLVEEAINGDTAVSSGNSEFQSKYDLPIKIVCQHSNFSLTLSNQYGPSLLDRINNALSGVARQITQMGLNASILDTLGKALENASIPLLPDFPVNMIGGLFNKLEQIRKENPTSVISGILAGERVVFPRVWQGSTFDNSYTIKFTIFADDSQNDYGETYKTSKVKRVLCMLYQLATILVLSTPRAVENSYFFTFPYVFQGSLHGVRQFEAGVITNVNISFDPEQAVIEPLGNYKCINIEFTVMDLYNTLVTLGNPTSANEPDLVPTTGKWLSYIYGYLNDIESDDDSD